jgi:hypothetical protein
LLSIERVKTFLGKKILLLSWTGCKKTLIIDFDFYLHSKGKNPVKITEVFIFRDGMVLGTYVRRCKGMYVVFATICPPSPWRYRDVHTYIPMT